MTKVTSESLQPPLQPSEIPSRITSSDDENDYEDYSDTNSSHAGAAPAAPPPSNLNEFLDQLISDAHRPRSPIQPLRGRSKQLRQDRIERRQSRSTTATPEQVIRKSLTNHYYNNDKDKDKDRLTMSWTGSSSSPSKKVSMTTEDFLTLSPPLHQQRKTKQTPDDTNNTSNNKYRQKTLDTFLDRPRTTTTTRPTDAHTVTGVGVGGGDRVISFTTMDGQAQQTYTIGQEEAELIQSILLQTNNNNNNNQKKTSRRGKKPNKKKGLDNFLEKRNTTTRGGGGANTVAGDQVTTNSTTRFQGKSTKELLDLIEVERKKVIDMKKKKDDDDEERPLARRISSRRKHLKRQQSVPLGLDIVVPSVVTPLSLESATTTTTTNPTNSSDSSTNNGGGGGTIKVKSKASKQQTNTTTVNNNKNNLDGFLERKRGIRDKSRVLPGDAITVEGDRVTTNSTRFQGKSTKELLGLIEMEKKKVADMKKEKEEQRPSRIGSRRKTLQKQLSVPSNLHSSEREEGNHTMEEEGRANTIMKLKSRSSKKKNLDGFLERKRVKNKMMGDAMTVEGDQVTSRTRLFQGKVPEAKTAQELVDMIDNMIVDEKKKVEEMKSEDNQRFVPGSTYTSRRTSSKRGLDSFLDNNKSSLRISRGAHSVAGDMVDPARVTSRLSLENRPPSPRAGSKHFQEVMAKLDSVPPLVTDLDIQDDDEPSTPRRGRRRGKRPVSIKVAPAETQDDDDGKPGKVRSSKKGNEKGDGVVTTDSKKRSSKKSSKSKSRKPSNSPALRRQHSISDLDRPVSEEEIAYPGQQRDETDLVDEIMRPTTPLSLPEKKKVQEMEGIEMTPRKKKSKKKKKSPVRDATPKKISIPILSKENDQARWTSTPTSRRTKRKPPEAQTENPGLNLILPFGKDDYNDNPLTHQEEETKLASPPLPPKRKNSHPPAKPLSDGNGEEKGRKIPFIEGDYLETDNQTVVSDITESAHSVSISPMDIKPLKRFSSGLDKISESVQPKTQPHSHDIGSSVSSGDPNIHIHQRWQSSERDIADSHKLSPKTPVREMDPEEKAKMVKKMAVKQK